MTDAEKDVLRTMREEKRAFKQLDRAPSGTSRYDEPWTAWNHAWRRYQIASNTLMAIAERDHRLRRSMTAQAH
jgi:hypothetical protein